MRDDCCKLCPSFEICVLSEDYDFEKEKELNHGESQDVGL